MIRNVEKYKELMFQNKNFKEPQKPLDIALILTGLHISALHNSHQCSFSLSVLQPSDQYHWVSSLVALVPLN